MASLAQLQADVANWLNRQDVLAVLPGFTLILETELSETLRARCMVASAVQAIDDDYIKLPADFCTMESMRDKASGAQLQLKDEWSGSWFRRDGRDPPPGVVYQATPDSPSVAYRLVADCIEFLPHPIIPDPPDPNWQPQNVLMGYYQKPRPLLLPTDTNAVLENLYAVYLYGLLKMGAIWALDDNRANQMDTLYSQVVTRANLWKQQSDYSGAPLRAEMAVQY